MKVKKQKIKLNTSGYSFRIKEGNRRMKIHLKLTKEETEQWNVIKAAVLGDATVSESQFAKFIFFKGLGNFMDEVTESIENLSDEDKEKIIAEHTSEISDTQDKEIELETTTLERKNTDADDNEADSQG